MTRQTTEPLKRWTQADYRRERIGMIYALVDPLTRQSRYVGYTSVSLEERLRQHIRQARGRRGRYHAANWINSLIAQGVKPEIVPLDSYIAHDWQARERHWIHVLRVMGCQLTNTQSGGNAGGPHRAASPLRGSQLSPELRAKMSAAARRRFADPAERAKISEAKKGRIPARPATPRKKVSLSHCPSGHEYTAANSVVYPGKARQCRTCIRDRARRYKANLRSRTPQTDADMDNARRVANS